MGSAISRRTRSFQYTMALAPKPDSQLPGMHTHITLVDKAGQIWTGHMEPATHECGQPNPDNLRVDWATMSVWNDSLSGDIHKLGDLKHRQIIDAHMASTISRMHVNTHRRQIAVEISMAASGLFSLSGASFLTMYVPVIAAMVYNWYYSEDYPLTRRISGAWPCVIDPETREAVVTAPNCLWIAEKTGPAKIPLALTHKTRGDGDIDLYSTDRRTRVCSLSLRKDVWCSELTMFNGMLEDILDAKATYRYVLTAALCTPVAGWFAGIDPQLMILMYSAMWIMVRTMPKA